MLGQVERADFEISQTSGLCVMHHDANVNHLVDQQQINDVTLVRVGSWISFFRVSEPDP